MNETATNYFVFFVLPALFILTWAWGLFYIRKVNAKIRQMTGSSGHLDSVEAGCASVTLERERRSGKTASA